MKLTILNLFLFCSLKMLVAQPNVYDNLIQKHRDELHHEFLDTAETPLTEEGLKIFEGLDYFKIDSLYRVSASLVRTPDEKIFEMQTSTDRLPKYLKYGLAEFTINGKKLKLNVYQNVKLANNEEYKDYLFIPFRDFTSGETTYGGGRYIETEIPNGDILIIDFNKAFNPYCAYNHKYSCPIPPLENTLKIAIKAGERSYSKH
ncbi:MAG: DUF1684 domain-containing protein [Crocinitomicaceae bacterium]|jgi:uncharacterized protein|nr:DUF1684 domain-containing protein [bacterium]MDO7613004.1 DUF1684 domain-containing protein [Crocinitomicaceae bacterium]